MVLIYERELFSTIWKTFFFSLMIFHEHWCTAMELRLIILNSKFEVANFEFFKCLSQSAWQKNWKIFKFWEKVIKLFWQVPLICQLHDHNFEFWTFRTQRPIKSAFRSDWSNASHWRKFLKTEKKSIKRSSKDLKFRSKSSDISNLWTKNFTVEFSLSTTRWGSK